METLNKEITIKLDKKKHDADLMIISINTDRDSFSITSSVYEKTRKSFNNPDVEEIDGRKYEHTSGGANHDFILEVRPDLKPIVDLHLANLDGVPMYAVENGYYHLQGYMGTANHNHTMTRKDVAEYLRVTEDEIQELADKKVTKQQFTEFVVSKYPQWKKDAEEGVKLIKSL